MPRPLFAPFKDASVITGPPPPLPPLLYYYHHIGSVPGQQLFGRVDRQTRRKDIDYCRTTISFILSWWRVQSSLGRQVVVAMVNSQSVTRFLCLSVCLSGWLLLYCCCIYLPPSFSSPPPSSLSYTAHPYRTRNDVGFPSRVSRQPWSLSLRVSE